MATDASRQQKELVKLLVLEHGQKKASELSNVPYETVRKWTQRGHWLASHNVPKSPVALVIDSLQSEIEQNGKQTKLSLSRATKRLAADSEQATLRHSRHVKDVVQSAALINPELYASKDKDPATVAVNIAILGS